MEQVDLSQLDLSKTIVLDAHLLKSYRKCQKYFWWFEQQHLISKGNKAAPAFGIVMHEGIEHFRRCKMAGSKFDDALYVGQQALVNAYKKHMPPENLSPTMQDDARSPKNALRIFTGYCHHYEPMHLIFHHVEVPFAIYFGSFEVDGRTIDAIYTGIIDAVLEMHSRIYVNDLKSTGWNINQEWLDGFKMDQGLLGYMVAAKQILGIDTNYAVVHGIWVKAEAKNPKYAKPIDEYFHTNELYWDQPQIDEWAENTLATAREIYMKQQDPAAHWQLSFGDACGMYGGCTYRPLCATTPGARKQKIDLDYEHAVWRPLEDERLQKFTP
jgi:hypothetical protein